MLSLLVISGLLQSPDRCVSHAFRSLRPMGILNGFNTRTVKVVEQRLIVVSVFQFGPLRELSKAHYNKLVTASELDGMPVTLITIDALLKFICVY